MDALEFIKAKRKLCNSNEFCDECPLNNINNGHDVNCVYLEDDYSEDFVEIVEKWWNAEYIPNKTKSDDKEALAYSE